LNHLSWSFTTSDRPTLVSLNRFEKKKNVALAVEAFSMIRQQLTAQDKACGLDKLRLVLAGLFSTLGIPTYLKLVGLARRI